MTTPQRLTYAIAPRVEAFSTLRHGGYSQGNHGAFNANLYCGDDGRAVLQNRALLCQAMGIGGERLVMPHQTHGCECRHINENFFKLSQPLRLATLEGVDALLTSMKNVCIGVSTADCIPIILYDTVHHSAAVVHAGWRGTVQRIVQNAVGRMNECFGTAPQHLKAVIGPGISLDSFEVGDEVYDAFDRCGLDMQRIARKYPTNDGFSQKWHIDLWECNRLQLAESGVPSAQIHTAGICTMQNSTDFFSARKLGISSGRILTGVILR